jgi:cell division protein FtsL
VSCYTVQLEPIWVSKNGALRKGEVRAFYVACSVVFIGMSFYVLFVSLRGLVVKVNI